jgi:hypothetical protein
MSEIKPENDVAEDFIAAAPAGDANPEEFTSRDLQDRVSPDTGTSYEPSGEPEVTPHDEVLTQDDPEDEA